jgi:hypothetical protein
MPLTWELPAGAAGGWLSVAAMLLPAGRGAASWLSGGGWLWPAGGGALTATLRGLPQGNLGAGLASSAPSALPPAGVVYLVVIAAEVAWLSLALLGLRIWWRTAGPGVPPGLAGRAEVETVLGVSRIRRDRMVIRPDLYASSSAPGGRS